MNQAITDFLNENEFFNYKKEQILENANEYFDQALVKTPKQHLTLDRKYLEISDLGEDRVIAVLELGGSIAKVALVEIKNGHYDVLFSHKKDFFTDVVYTPELLFGSLTDYLEEVIPPHFLLKLKELIFVFAFPFEHTEVENGFDGICTSFTKERKEEGIKGLQIGKAFQEYLANKGFDGVRVHVFNDATISLMAIRTLEILNKANYDAHINIIIGTGYNLAYLREVDGNLMLINTEGGNAKLLECTSFDTELQNGCMNPFSYEAERMVAGAGIGTLFEIIVKHASNKHLVDESDYHLVKKLNRDTGKIERSLTDPQSIYLDQKSLVQIYEAIIARASDLVTGILQAARDLSPDGKAGILSCGSVFWKGLDYRPQVETKLKEIDPNFEILHQEDAAILGAITVSRYLKA